MKNLLIFLSLLYFQFALFAQNWQLVNPEYHYHYVMHFADGTVSDSLWAYSIFVDRVDGENFYLNRYSELPSTPGIQGTEYTYFQLFQASFLKKKIIPGPEGATSFQDPGSIVFYPVGKATPWLFDSTQNIFVLTDSVYLSSQYGEEDSLRNLLLSSGDTLILSKNYGIIRFPERYGTQQYYRQIGIKGPEKGFRFPSAKEVFSFSIGDKFEYKTANINSRAYPISEHRHGAVEAYKIHQVEIIDSLHLPNAIVYTTLNNILIESGFCKPFFSTRLERCKKMYFDRLPPDQRMEPPSYNTGSYGVDTQIFQKVSKDTIFLSLEKGFVYDTLSQYLEKEDATFRSLPELHVNTLYPGEVSWLSPTLGSHEGGGPSFALPVYSIHSSGKLRGEISWRICNSRKSVNTNMDSVRCNVVLDANYNTGAYRVNWVKNLGITRTIWDAGPNTEKLSFSKALTAYQTKFHAMGEFSSDSLFNMGPAKQINGRLPYPNPAKEKFSLGPYESPRTLFISIYDMQGGEKYQGKVEVDWMWEFSLQSFPPGVYLVNIWDNKDKSWSRHRLVVEN